MSKSRSEELIGFERWKSWRSFLGEPSAIEPTEIKIHSEAEQIDETRAKIFDLLDRMSRQKKELNEQCVPQSMCTQLEQAIRDTEVVLAPELSLLVMNHFCLSDGHHQGKWTQWSTCHWTLHARTNNQNDHSLARWNWIRRWNCPVRFQRRSLIHGAYASLVPVGKWWIYSRELIYCTWTHPRLTLTEETISISFTHTMIISPEREQNKPAIILVAHGRLF